MSQTNNQAVSPEIETLVKLGRAGKLLTIVVTFNEITDDNGNIINNTRLYYLRNQTWEQVRALRATIYTSGFMYPVATDHFKVIHPMDIKAVDIWRQNEYFK